MTLTPYEGKKIRCGLTVSEYEALLEKQGGGCAICGRPPKKQRLNVDHCHAAEKKGFLKVRGLLCAMCNHRILGMIERLRVNPQRIVDYLAGAEATAFIVAGMIRGRCSDVAPS
jgi:hypothetical protein